MKKLFSWVYMILNISIITLISSCSSELEDVMASYNGIVYEASTNEPFANLEVKVTNGSDIHAITKTDIDGSFTISIKVNEINGDYYILIGDETCISKIVKIPGYASDTTNLGIILVAGPSVPIVNLKENRIDNGIIYCSASITANGRLEIEEKGFCLGKSAGPTIKDKTIICGSGSSSFMVEIPIADLDVSSTYFIRPYAINSKGTGYGKEFSVATSDGLAIVKTGFYSFRYDYGMSWLYDIGDIGATFVEMWGYLDNDNGFKVSERGFCWDTNGNPTIESNVRYIGGGEEGNYSLLIKDLKPNTQYFFRAYARNENGVSYGNVASFTTEDGKPTVETTNVRYGATILECHGNVFDDAEFPILRKGFCYSTHESPTLMDSVVTSSSKDTGEYTITIDGLEEGTTYYVKAFAENQQGISYGAEIEITTMVIAEFSVVDANDNYIPYADLYLEYTKYVCDHQGKKKLRTTIGIYRLWAIADGYEMSKHEDILINRYNKSFKIILSRLN